MFDKIFNTMLIKTLTKTLIINFTATLLLLSPMSFAQSATELGHTSQSFGGLTNNLTTQEKKQQISQTNSTIKPRNLAYKGMSRTDVNTARQQQINSVSILSTKSNVESNSAFYHSFAIYSGYSQLIEDIDEDGYYQTFSVSFDADILSPIMNEQAVVYADLYLSENGGPWVLYFSTDDFVITGDETADEFEVVTQLDSGYIPNHYDVLIDLYEVGYNDVVATFSSDDSNELYALPLESSDYDPEYIEVEYYSEHGGGSAVLFCLIILSLFYRRVFVKQ